MINISQSFAGKQLVHIDVQCFTKWEHRGGIGQSFPTFPLGYCFITDFKLIRQLALRHVFFFSAVCNQLPDFNLIHKGYLLYMKYKPVPQKGTPMSVSYTHLPESPAEGPPAQ